MPELITFPAQFVDMYNRQSLAELVREFQTLDAELNNPDYEARKLIIVKRLLLHLQGPNDIIPVEGRKESDYSQALLKLAYLFCLIFGGLENASSSFLFSSNLFTLIPGIGSLALYSVISVYVFLDAILFYAFEISFLKKAMGIVSTGNSDCVLNEVYAQQLEAVMEINRILDSKDTQTWDPEAYQAYAAAMAVFNDHLLKKHAGMKNYTSSNFSVGIEQGVVLFGALACVADSYFMAKTALLTLHIAFTTSPLGWILVVGMVVASLVLYYTMRVQSMSELLNPDRESHNALQEDLNKFEKYVHRQPYLPNGSMMFKRASPASISTNLSSELIVDPSNNASSNRQKK